MNVSPITAAEVLRRYKVDDDLPTFSGMTLSGVNQVGEFGDGPLHVASVRGKLDEMAALIHAGAVVNAPGEHGYTPLNEAVGQEHLEAIQLLLDHGARIEATNNFGETPVDIARIKKRFDIVELLLGGAPTS